MLIRSPALSDVNKIASVHMRAWAVAYTHFLPASVIENLSVAEYRAKWRRILADRSAQNLVAEIDGDIVGLISYAPSGDDDVADGTQEISVLYVAPDYWSKGVGRCLWSAARESLQQHGSGLVMLWVLVGNQRAIRFYEKIGFERDPVPERTILRGGAELQQARYVYAIKFS